MDYAIENFLHTYVIDIFKVVHNLDYNLLRMNGPNVEHPDNLVLEMICILPILIGPFITMSYSTGFNKDSTIVVLW